MRRKPSQNNYHKKRYPQNRGGGGGPKKNYGALREKYQAQARDALSSGDRVMAEYYYQHAEHCFRMLAEETSRAPRPSTPARDDQSEKTPADNSASAVNQAEKTPADNPAPVVNKAETKDAEQLPAFITAGKAEKPVAPVAPETKD